MDLDGSLPNFGVSQHDVVVPTRIGVEHAADHHLRRADFFGKHDHIDARLRVDQLVLWGGSIPPELDLGAWSAKLHGAAITLVAGSDDEYATPAAVAAEAERLSVAGVAFTLHRFGGGHVIDPAALVQLAEGFAGR